MRAALLKIAVIALVGIFISETSFAQVVFKEDASTITQVDLDDLSRTVLFDASDGLSFIFGVEIDF